MTDQWIDTEISGLPDEPGLYAVCGALDRKPTFAVFVLGSEKWMVIINNNYWPIEGVRYYKKADRTPKALELAGGAAESGGINSNG